MHKDIKMFLPYLPRGGSRMRQNRSGGGGGGGGPFFKKLLLQTGRLQQHTEFHSNDPRSMCYEVLLFFVPFRSQIIDLESSL